MRKLYYSNFNGLINLDKPVGVTSADCVRFVKRIFGAKKVGHGGTLDPFATGVLPIGIGKGTKALQNYLKGNKSYSGAFRQGYLTETLDCEGKLVELQSDLEIDIEDLKVTAKQFLGTYDQQTPLFSARKVNGKKLYNYARRGDSKINIKPPYRAVEIFEFQLNQIEDQMIHFEVNCSKGTYVRQLVQDLLRKAVTEKKVVGTLEILRRTKVGPLEDKNSISPQQLFETVMKSKSLEGNWCQPL
ncbi:MAG: tRNA pseudouridine(55) synthase TruB [bacterium]|nr:tRNA pseudouridine(55) synthase TruB [bacterium]